MKSSRLNWSTRNIVFKLALLFFSVSAVLAQAQDLVALNQAKSAKINGSKQRTITSLMEDFTKMRSEYLLQQ